MLILVCPALNNVEAVDKMMKYITRFENSIPTFTSHVRYLISASVAPTRCQSCFRPMLNSSSTS